MMNGLLWFAFGILLTFSFNWLKSFISPDIRCVATNFKFTLDEEETKEHIK